MITMKKEILNGELMNEEQLDKVVGGARGELSCDTKLLNAIGLMPNSHEPGYCEKYTKDVIGEISDAVRKTRPPFHLEVEIIYSANGSNQYKLTGYAPGGAVTNDVSRAYFYRCVCEAVGKPDFDYEKYL